ncbi:MAG: aspartate aminotransferase family protein [Methylovirgula sp.]
MTSALLPTYARADVAFERGEGAWLISTKGERFLDFGCGIAVTALGHAHPHLVETLTAQGQRLWHTSNLFQIPQAEQLAERLVAATFADFVFFTNSGTEACEGAIKTARKYHYASGHPDKTRIITLEGAFHGRSLAALAAGGNAKYLEGFEPRMPGFDQVPFGDLDAVKAAIGPQTGAILIEPIQGEGGVRVLPSSFLQGVRKLCDENGLLLIFDEVQTGVGRTGPLFAYQRAGVAPDIMMIAKGIGGGFPLGAFLTTREAGKGMTYGTHGTTYGGNPLATAIGNAVLDIVLADGFLDHAVRMGALLKTKLAELQAKYSDVIAEVRGEGLLLGVKTHVPIAEFVAAARKEKIVIIGAADNVARILPPLIVNEAEIAEGLQRLEAAAAHIAQGLQKEMPSRGAAE